MNQLALTQCYISMGRGKRRKVMVHRKEVNKATLRFPLCMLFLGSYNYLLG